MPEKNYQKTIGNKIGSGALSPLPANYSIRKALIDLNNAISNGNQQGRSFFY